MIISDPRRAKCSGCKATETTYRDEDSKQTLFIRITHKDGCKTLAARRNHANQESHLD